VSRWTDEGITTEMYREDNTEVEIHASSLETFVQTDKPIYKPGETVVIPSSVLLVSVANVSDNLPFLSGTLNL
jgi:hypothetical protein